MVLFSASRSPFADTAICKQCRDQDAVREFSTRFAHEKQHLESLRYLGLAEFSKEYKGYLLKKYGLGLKDLSDMQIREQVENLTKCREDPEMLGKLQDYLIKLAA